MDDAALGLEERKLWRRVLRERTQWLSRFMQNRYSNETALVLGVVCFLFFFCVSWLRVTIWENRGTEITLLHDPERLILRINWADKYGRAKQG